MPKQKCVNRFAEFHEPSLVTASGSDEIVHSLLIKVAKGRTSQKCHTRMRLATIPSILDWLDGRYTTCNKSSELLVCTPTLTENEYEPPMQGLGSLMLIDERSTEGILESSLHCNFLMKSKHPSATNF
jgi:hypothetical protein